MINPNEKGILYYGTDLRHIVDIDINGLKTPRMREEQYISVSISGYESNTKCNHPELQEIARVLSKELKIADYKEAQLSFKPGYVNTITCLHGCGPNPNPFYPSFFGLMKNTRTENTVTAVMAKEAGAECVCPDRSRELEYLSLALHGFVKRIDPELIVGWIVHRSKVDEVESKMRQGVMRRKQIWCVEDFETFEYDFEHRARYAVFPSNISSYMKDMESTSIGVHETCKNHLKSIIGEAAGSEISWEADRQVLKQKLSEWYKSNENRLCWNEREYKYRVEK